MHINRLTYAPISTLQTACSLHK